MIWCRFSKDGETSFGRVQDERGLTVFRSEEHTSELQSRSDLVCRLLLEKKKKKTKKTKRQEHHQNNLRRAYHIQEDRHTYDNSHHTRALHRRQLSLLNMHHGY